MATKKCPYCAEEIQSEAIKCRHCGSMLPPMEGTFAAQGAVPQPAWPDPGATPGKRLFRSQSDRILLGICGGIARYFNLDSTILRVITVLVTIFTLGCPAVVVYLILALVIPPDPSGF